ncbi:hypothetical protein MCETOYE15_00377 [Candidatus Nanopelagicaceae bacterium]
MIIKPDTVTNSPENLTHDRVHVAVREIKEESYRAMRCAGYSWGQSQSAGRIASVSEIFWGTGISSALSDVRRRFVTKRTPKISRNPNEILVNTRGLSTLMAASFAIALSQSQPEMKVFIKGSDFGPDVAAAIWDTKRVPYRTITWGTGQDSETNDLSVLENGDLVSHSRHITMKSSPKKYASLWFVICHSESISGNIVIRKTEKEERVNNALVSGLDVSKNKWEKLSSESFKYLVAE